MQVIIDCMSGDESKELVVEPNWNHNQLSKVQSFGVRRCTHVELVIDNQLLLVVDAEQLIHAIKAAAGIS